MGVVAGLVPATSLISLFAPHAALAVLKRASEKWRVHLRRDGPAYSLLAPLFSRRHPSSGYEPPPRAMRKRGDRAKPQAKSPPPRAPPRSFWI